MNVDFQNNIFGAGLSQGTGSQEDNVERLKEAIASSDKVLIGAGAGLSTSAGFEYTGERLQKYFFDFVTKYGIPDMYSGGFIVMDLTPEIKWAFWSRYIYINRYMDPPRPVYESLLRLVKNKDYFVLTTNVDHCFQKAGFDKARLFYTQGDYGLFQSADPTNNNTYDNHEWVMKAMEAQGFIKRDDGVFDVPNDKSEIKMEIPRSLIPRAPEGAGEAVMNLRADETFVEDDGWHRAAERYADYVNGLGGHRTLLLELGVGFNTPVIIKYPFWKMTATNSDATYCCVDMNACCPSEIEDKSIVVRGDIGDTLECLY